MKGRLLRVSMLVLVAVLVLTSSVFAAPRPPVTPTLSVGSWGYVLQTPGDFRNARFYAGTITWAGYPTANYLALGWAQCDAYGNPCGEVFENSMTRVPITKRTTSYAHLEAPAPDPGGLQSWLMFYDCSATTVGGSHPFVMLLNVVYDRKTGQPTVTVLATASGSIADLVNMCIS